MTLNSLHIPVELGLLLQLQVMRSDYSRQYSAAVLHVGNYTNEVSGEETATAWIEKYNHNSKVW